MNARRPHRTYIEGMGANAATLLGIMGSRPGDWWTVGELYSIEPSMIRRTTRRQLVRLCALGLVESRGVPCRGRSTDYRLTPAATAVAVHFAGLLGLDTPETRCP